jgi:hypothetical protein
LTKTLFIRYNNNLNCLKIYELEHQFGGSRKRQGGGNDGRATFKQFDTYLYSFPTSA